MENKEIVKLLEEIGLLLELDGESPFKSRAYENVARQIEQSDESVEQLAKEGRLREIKGVGDALEQKITEYVETGKLTYRDKLKAKCPDSLFEMMEIPGLGPKRIKQFYEEKGIDSLEKLEAACRDGSLEGLKGFGKKMEEKILEGIGFLQQHSGQHRYDVAYTEARRLVDMLGKVKGVKRIETAGSLRRHKEVVKDIDIIATAADSGPVMEAFTGDGEVARVTGHGDTKSSVVLKSGIAADLRVVEDALFPYALMHFTGSKEHNVVMRQRAKDKDMKLSEYGLFKGDKLVKCKSEEEIYKKFGMPYIPPELREDMGEFDVKEIPDLVDESDLKGVIHCHSTYSDGKNTLETMAKAAKGLGYGYMVISDHSQSAAYAGGLQPERVKKQHKEIDKLNASLGRFRILKGIESDIKKDGSLDYTDAVLKTFDVIIASVHSILDMDKATATKRVIKAVEHPETNILGHPTGRLLLQRQGFPLDYDKVFEACAANQVAVEINGNCHRLDLDWRYVRKARDAGVKLSIGPDAHSVDGLGDVRYGLGIARKGWLEAGDLLNSMTAAQLLKWCSK